MFSLLPKGKKRKKNQFSDLDLARLALGRLAPSELRQDDDGTITVVFDKSHPYYNHDNIYGLVKLMFEDADQPVMLADYASHVSGYYVELSFTILSQE